MSDGAAHPRSSIATATEPAIVFDRVGVSYGRGRKTTVALTDFTLRVAAGETVALLGPSGSGKSTALEALAGFVRPTSGAVRLAGRDVTDLSPAKRGIGVVVQSYALFPHMRVHDNVAFGLKAHRVPRKDIDIRVTEALAMVGMVAYNERLPRELSGGQQQRVAIARALAIRPELGATIMVYPATWKTLPVTIFGLTDRGEVFNAAASTCLLLAVTLVALVALGRLRGRATLR